MATIQEKIIDFVDLEGGTSQNFQQLVDFLNEINIRKNDGDLIELFHLILLIANNHHRKEDFFSKIFQIIKLFTNDIQRLFSNNEIYRFFSQNPRIILFFIQEKTIIINESIAGEIKTSPFKQYFYPELKKFDDFECEEFEDYESFQRKREIGENPDIICQLIRKDSIDEFLEYVKRNQINIKSEEESMIKNSIFETNTLLNSYINFAQYAAFYGSLNIISALKSADCDYLDSFLWKYAIHSNNSELIYYLDQNVRKPTDSFKECFDEAIKCHHNQLAVFIKDNLIRNKKTSNSPSCFNYFNYLMFPENISGYSTIFTFCWRDYPSIVEIEFEKVYDKNLMENIFFF